MDGGTSQSRRAGAERVRIEEVDCGLLDLALALSFDARELENMLSQAATGHAGCTCHPQRGPIAHAHHGAHHGGPFARRLEALLDLVHGVALRRMDDLEHPGELLAETLEQDLWARDDLAGLTWAVARCARLEVAQLRPCFTRVLSLDAVRALAAKAQEVRA